MKTIALCLVLGVCFGVVAVSQEADPEMEAAALTEPSETAAPEEPQTETPPDLQMPDPAPMAYYPPCSSIHGQPCIGGGPLAHCWSDCAGEPGICRCGGSPQVWECWPSC